LKRAKATRRCWVYLSAQQTAHHTKGAVFAVIDPIGTAAGIMITHIDEHQLHSRLTHFRHNHSERGYDRSISGKLNLQMKFKNE
jgi:hypothetical protein